MRHDYTLFKRKNSSVWYFYYYDGYIRKAASTGASRKYDAEQYAQSFLRVGKFKHITFSDYTKDFFLWDSCEWIKRQHAKGRPFSKATAYLRRGHLTKHLIPTFGKYPLSSLNRVQVERWLLSLYLSNSTKNAILYTLRIVLREAEAEGVIERDPLEKMEVMGRNSKIRDAFTLEELKLMFPQEREELMKIWREAKYATLFYILSITGMRQGEARALQWKDVFWDGGLVISKSVKFDRSIGSTKTQNVRVVLLTSRGIELLKQWKEESPYAEPEDYIFFSTRGDRVLCSQTIRHLLHEVCKKLSIKTEGRILVVHSFRHTFNTLMRRVLPQATLQAITGHSTEKMSEHYDHPTPNDLFNNIKESQKLIEGVLK